MLLNPSFIWSHRHSGIEPTWLRVAVLHEFRLHQIHWQGLSEGIYSFPTVGKWGKAIKFTKAESLNRLCNQITTFRPLYAKKNLESLWCSQIFACNCAEIPSLNRIDVAFQCWFRIQISTKALSDSVQPENPPLSRKQRSLLPQTSNYSIQVGP